MVELTFPTESPKFNHLPPPYSPNLVTTPHHSVLTAAVDRFRHTAARVLFSDGVATTLEAPAVL